MEATQQPTPSPVNTNVPILSSKARYTDEKIHLKQNNKDVDGMLMLFNDKVSFICETDPTRNIDLPLSNISLAKQKVAFLIFYTSNNKKLHFNFSGSALKMAAVQGVGGIAGMALSARYIKQTGIDSWLPGLAKKGVKIKDAFYNTGRGYTRATIRGFIWSLLVIFSFVFVVGGIGRLTGRNKGSVLSFVVILLIIGLCIFGLKKVKSGTRTNQNIENTSPSS